MLFSTAFLHCKNVNAPLSSTSTKGNQRKLSKREAAEKAMGPWLTGPLLTPSGNAVPYGHVNIEPYVFVTKNIGFWNNRWQLHRQADSNSINFQLSTQIGLTKSVELSMTPQVMHTKKDGFQSTSFGDLPAKLGFQLMRDDPNGWKPSMKFNLGEIFPTGVYSDLNPDNASSDATGAGGFMTTLDLVVSKVFYFGQQHFLATRANLSYAFNTRTEVSGFNAYGGGFDTEGIVDPGNSFTAALGLEFTLTRHWALAADFLFIHEGETKFSGTPGTKKDGTLASIGNGEVFQYSVAPAIEYNYNAHVGVIFGYWFDFYGKNTKEFESWIGAINIYY